MSPELREEVRESCGGSLIRPPRYPKLGKIGTRFPTRSRRLGNTRGWLAHHSGSWTCISLTSKDCAVRCEQTYINMRLVSVRMYTLHHLMTSHG